MLERAPKKSPPSYFLSLFKQEKLKRPITPRNLLLFASHHQKTRDQDDDDEKKKKKLMSVLFVLCIYSERGNGTKRMIQTEKCHRPSLNDDLNPLLSALIDLM